MILATIIHLLLVYFLNSIYFSSSFFHVAVFCYSTKVSVRKVRFTHYFSLTIHGTCFLKMIQCNSGCHFTSWQKNSCTQEIRNRPTFSIVDVKDPVTEAEVELSKDCFWIKKGCQNLVNQCVFVLKNKLCKLIYNNICNTLCHFIYFVISLFVKAIII